MISKKAQSELVGFGIIIVIVAVLLLVFLSFSINNKPETLQSYELSTFLQTGLQYTSNCEISYHTNFVDMRRLAKECARNSTCEDGNLSCQVLEDTWAGLIESGWQVGPEWPTKGYSFKMYYDGEILLELEKGNETNQIKGVSQNFDEIDVFFQVYS